MEEVQEMCEMAVEHAPNYQVWWNVSLRAFCSGRLMAGSARCWPVGFDAT